MEAMYEAKLEKERERQRLMANSVQQQGGDDMDSVHMRELASLDMEVERISLEYSNKCVEVNVLQSRLNAQDKKLLIAKSRIQELLAR